MPSRILLAFSFLSLLSLPSCIRGTPDPTAPRATAIPVEQADPDYWLQQPANVSARFTDFDKLFDACQHVANRRGFRIDRADFRAALLTTKPLTSSQIFEPFISDITTVQAGVRSNLATYRRTVFFEFARTETEPPVFTVTPKVLIERQATRNGRAGPAVVSTAAVNPTLVIGSREQDAGQFIPVTYWYATGRDAELERRFVRDLTTRLY